MTSLFKQSLPQPPPQGGSTIRRKASHNTSNSTTSSSSNNNNNHRIRSLFTNGGGRPHSSSSTTSTTSTKRILPQCLVFSCITICCFQCLTLIPILFYQEQTKLLHPPPHVTTTTTTTTTSTSTSTLSKFTPLPPVGKPFVPNKASLSQYKTYSTKDGRNIPIFTMSDLSTIFDESIVTTSLPLLRGIQSEIIFPSSVVPDALIGAQRAQITCPTLNVNSLAYWNDPIGIRDVQYQSPFRVYPSTSRDHHHQHDDEMYISFAPDPGGWNNIRMSMEIIFVIAAATQRTLILPPKEPLYLLHHDNQQKHRGFADFFPIHTPQFQKIVKTITFEEFLIKEGKVGPLSITTLVQQQQSGKINSTIPIPTYEQILNAADHCDKRKASTTNCVYVYNYLQLIGYTPDLSASQTCMIFDEMVYQDPNAELPAEVQEYIQSVCGEKRQQVYFNAQETQHHRVLHFQADKQEYRLLTHFYNMIHFTNPVHDHYYKRFVRDFLHYHDSIYCAAGKIVKAVQLESALLNPSNVPDRHGAGGYSALHVRRGDLQYKKVKISAAEWYNNTKEIWKPNEILYIATDEKDKSFFNDLAKHHTLRFLDDYWDMAGLSDLDPNYMGMIDTIVASRGRAFAGTWFSTFSGYINRLRGYHGMSMQDSWYSFLDRKTAVHEWHIVDDFVYAYEFPDGWIGIDADTFPTRDKF